MRAQQRPKLLHGIDMYFAKSITILITSIFAVAMANRLMTISRFRQAVVDAIFIRIHQSSRYNRRTNHRTDSFLFHILEHLNCDLSATLNDPEYRGFFFHLSDGALDLYGFFSDTLRVSLMPS